MNDDAGQYEKFCDKPHPPPPPDEQPFRRNTARSKSFSNFCQDYKSSTGPQTISHTLDTIIKHPGEVSYAILAERRPFMLMHLFVIFAISVLAYGLIMGSFSGGHQWLHTPACLLFGWLASALICLPSLHIFTSLGGGELSLSDSAGLLLQSMTLHAVVLIGFAPVSFIFSQSTDGVFFMGALHLGAWLISARFALQLIRNAFLAISGRQGFLTLWCGIFILVALQMSTTLRPLVGEFDGNWAMDGKRFFISHWFQFLNQSH